MKRKTILKRAVSCFIAAFIAAGFMTVPFMANALEPAKLTVTSANGEPGKDVVISVSVSANSGIAAMDFILKYDNSKLLYKSYKQGIAAEGGLFTLYPNYKNQDGSSALKQAFAHIDGITAEGSIVDVTFTVAPGWSGSTAITLEITDDISDANYKMIPYDVKNGSVAVDTAPGETDITNEAGETVSTLNESGDTTINSGSSTIAVADSTKKASSQKTLIIILSVCGVLIVGASAAFVMIKKK